MGIVFDIIRLASVYAVMALGFVVVYRTSRVLNLTHPGFVLLGGYLAVSFLPPLATTMESPFWFIAAVITLLALGVPLGLGVYYFLIRPLAGQSRISIIMMTLGVLFLLEAVEQFIWRGQTSFMALPGSTVAFEIFGARVRLFTLIAPVVAAIVLGSVALFYSRSRWGIQMRAVAENATLAARRGINIDRIGAMSWALAVVLAFVASFLQGTVSPVTPLLVIATIKGFTVALVGGLDSLGGIVPAALLVAASEILVVRYVDQQLGEAVPFVVLLVVLLFKPWGIYGTVEELDRV